MTTGLLHKNVELRRLQFRAAESPAASIKLANAFIATKIRNCRTFLRRNAEDVPVQAIDMLRRLADDAETCDAAESLLGIEGTAARVYFEHFPRLFKRPDQDGNLAFDFDGRNRRPPRDPVNALLSLAYSLLAKDLTVVLQAVGFDPFLGFFHRPRYGRPALALDLMEEFRPLVADSVVLTVVNTGVVQRDDFVGRAGAVSLSDSARGRFLRAYERRMDELVTHPCSATASATGGCWRSRRACSPGSWRGDSALSRLPDEVVSCARSTSCATTCAPASGCGGSTRRCAGTAITFSSPSSAASCPIASAPR